MTASASSSVVMNSAPSRRDNPFATCWTKPGAIPFRFSPGETAGCLVNNLAAHNWQAAIVGPHGSGKSTLLESLKPGLVDAGRRLLTISLHDGERRLPRNAWNNLTANGESTDWNRRNEHAGSQSIPFSPLLVIVDGYEQLSWLERLRLLRRCRKANIGLLITAHARTSLPTLVRLTPERDLVAQLVADLCAEVSTSITPDDVTASHACHGSNVREIFFDLYDRHERNRRQSRTGSATRA